MNTCPFDFQRFLSSNNDFLHTKSFPILVLLHFLYLFQLVCCHPLPATQHFLLSSLCVDYVLCQKRELFSFLLFMESGSQQILMCSQIKRWLKRKKQPKRRRRRNETQQRITAAFCIGPLNWNSVVKNRIQNGCEIIGNAEHNTSILT